MSSAVGLVVWPEDYMPKCRDGEALRVPLEKACARVEAAAGKEAGARRRLTGVATAYSCLPHYRIPVTGTDGRVTFPYHSETLLSEGDERATMALVVLHGAYRDADSYFCAMYDIQHEQGYRSDAFWNTSRPSGDWRAGAPSSPESGHGRTVSSFAAGQPASRWNCQTDHSLVSPLGPQVMDTFVKLLSDERLFPKLEAITLLGHSAGGQFVQRYALMTVLPTAPRAGLSVRYVIANPSSFAYLDASRPVYSCGKYAAHSGVPHRGFSADEPGAFVCGDEAYNAWPYGLDGWVGGATVNQSIAIYPERDVSYLNGQNDTCNDGLPECDSECWQRDNEESPCFRNRMDTRCPAMLTGPWRRARGAAYMAFLRKFYGAPSRPIHRHYVVPGAGHDAMAVFESAAALSRVFGSGGNGSGREEILEARALSGPRVRRRYPKIAAALASEPGDDLEEELERGMER
ncbi:hypothetical protein EMIHUDRAFT_238346 [Emiliania huxleyi CCMP1516]|uniref:AB hydrolase-1 domain-containing protein n=2 Tax=Emiliania huxleyi TaxID=2903 RepID=A0A0D3JML5_EMIH1|nr:hypothetical protein EMIHUDRAFT_238346 [Emiliania huxleyi CCMP1516]EOD24750.1 hypothetical protein EMIHUDRAFT_238346 [Emiliania huxleyi CCMP1516]|eukprot:XP_005777179.1 hypothetical protein EMIHUDRAFT_238346 [Emiliania huxleyi CCMP1516]